MNSTNVSRDTLSPVTPARRGGIVIFVFFVLLIGWAAISSLSSAAIAPGEVAVDSRRKTVQHLEGGIVEAIYVSEGSEVAQGQKLIKLSKTQPLAQQQQLSARLAAVSAREARLVAERDGQAEIIFPESLSEQTDSPDITEIMRGEERIFIARAESHASHKAILQQRIAQYEEEIEGLNGEVQAADKQLAYLEDEIQSMEALVQKKLVGKSRLLELQREAADIGGEKSRNQAAVARTKQNIAEQQLQILELDSTRSAEVVAELRDVQTNMQEMQEQMRAAGDILARTDILAPITGTVVDLQVHTVGGVIGARDALMDIVPADDKLVVNAKVSPQDIDVVRSGLSAHVRLLAFNQRETPPLNGQVAMVSADRLTDELTGAPYYLTKIVFAEEEVPSRPEVYLQPGMQAEVMIVTGERSALSYLLEPLTRSIRRSFRED